MKVSEAMSRDVRIASPDATICDAAKAMAKKFGVTFKEIYWTLGSYDEVIVFDAPDDASIAAFLASVGSLGNIRTQTLRAFSQADVNGILEKLA